MRSSWMATESSCDVTTARCGSSRETATIGHQDAEPRSRARGDSDRERVVRWRSRSSTGQRLARLQRAAERLRREARLGRYDYFVFDVLFLDGKDLRPSPFRTRRQMLETVLASHQQDRVRLSATFNADGASVLQSACKMGLEGIIANAPGRTLCITERAASPGSRSGVSGGRSR